MCLVVVIPADTESLKIRDNARQTFEEIEELKPSLGSIFMLDNNSGEKLQINRAFARTAIWIWQRLKAAYIVRHFL